MDDLEKDDLESYSRQRFRSDSDSEEYIAPTSSTAIRSPIPKAYSRLLFSADNASHLSIPHYEVPVSSVSTNLIGSAFKHVPRSSSSSSTDNPASSRSSVAPDRSAAAASVPKKKVNELEAHREKASGELKSYFYKQAKVPIVSLNPDIPDFLIKSTFNEIKDRELNLARELALDEIEGVVKVVDVREFDGRPTIVMEKQGIQVDQIPRKVFDSDKERIRAGVKAVFVNLRDRNYFPEDHTSRNFTYDRREKKITFVDLGDIKPTDRSLITDGEIETVVEKFMEKLDSEILKDDKIIESNDDRNNRHKKRNENKENAIVSKRPKKSKKTNNEEINNNNIEINNIEINNIEKTINNEETNNDELTRQIQISRNERLETQTKSMREQRLINRNNNAAKPKETRLYQEEIFDEFEHQEELAYPFQGEFTETNVLWELSVLKKDKYGQRQRISDDQDFLTHHFTKEWQVNQMNNALDDIRNNPNKPLSHEFYLEDVLLQNEIIRNFPKDGELINRNRIKVGIPGANLSRWPKAKAETRTEGVKGIGLFCRAPVNPGDIIDIYRGHLSVGPEGKKYRDKDEARNYIARFGDIDTIHVVGAEDVVRKRKNEKLATSSRWGNGSRANTGNRPNAHIMWRLQVEQIPNEEPILWLQPLIVATKSIKAGKFVAVSYGTNYGNPRLAAVAAQEEIKAAKQK